MLFTSGSTGEPKGVVVPHRAPAAVVPPLRSLYGVGEGEFVLHFHGAGGDTSLEEILPALTGGATLVIDDGVREGFARVAEEQQLSVAVLPTGFWDSLTGDLLHQGARLPASLRTVVIGGEAVRADMLERWRRSAAPRTSGWSIPTAPRRLPWSRTRCSSPGRAPPRCPRPAGTCP